MLAQATENVDHCSFYDILTPKLDGNNTTFNKRNNEAEDTTLTDNDDRNTMPMNNNNGDVISEYSKRYNAISCFFLSVTVPRI